MRFAGQSSVTEDEHRGSHSMLVIQYVTRDENPGSRFVPSGMRF